LNARRHSHPTTAHAIARRIMPRLAKPPLGAAPCVTIPSLTSRVGHRALAIAVAAMTASNRK
jgi:hypothetical protein